MKARTFAALCGVALLILAAPGEASASAAAGWSLDSVAVPTNFAPGPGGQNSFQVNAMNIGGAPTDGSTLRLVDRLPEGVTVESVELSLNTETGVADFGPALCESDDSGTSPVVTCTISPVVVGAWEPTVVRPGESLVMVVFVRADAGTSGPLTNTVTLEGGGVPPQSTEGQNEASAVPATTGLSEFRAQAVSETGAVLTQAGAHPFQYVTTYAVNTEPGPPTGAPFRPAGGDVKDVEVALPPGLVGNPTAVSTCGHSEFLEQVALDRPSGNGQNFRNGCPSGSVVGFIAIRQLEGIRSPAVEPIYELEPPLGMPAQLAFQVVGAPFFIDTKVRTAGDYGITAFLPNLAQVKRASSATVVLWGVPAAAAHDAIRGDCLNENPSGKEGVSSGACPASITPRPFLTNSTACAGTQATTFSFDTWSLGAFASATSFAPPNTGCGSVPFAASLSARPQTTVADSPTGLAVDLHVEGDEAPNGVAAAHLRDAEVSLPAGLTVNPSSAVGLGACSPDQVGLTSAMGSGGASFSAEPARCPDDSKLGTVEIDTPLLDHPVDGAIYLASQGQNPFGSLLALYIAADDPRTGVVVKLAGQVEADPTTGQLTARFANNPQLPFEDLEVHFFEGPAAALRTPATCGRYTTTSDLRPWSAPGSGPDATPSSSFAVGSAPGGPCAVTEAAQPNSPSFEAGTERPLAGAFSPFVLRLSRGDGSQQLRQLDLNLPKGLLGKLARIPYCPDAALAAAERGSGRRELAQPSCPTASEVGGVTVGAGAGPRPLLVHGAVYLAGPYRGAPLSLAVITPAVAGPFDLGTVVVRAAISVDPRSAQISVRTDPFPTVLQGIPLDLRSLEVALGRADFTLNPTSCASAAITGTVTSPAGTTAAVDDRFGIVGCRELGFSPKLSLRLSGGTTRAKDPALHAVLTQPGGQTNIGRVAVTLPPTLFIDQRHIDNPCTRVQFAASRCPAASILGHARAYTPLLDKPIEGPVIFRANGGERKLPDMVAVLNGQIQVELVGYINAASGRGGKPGGVRTTFAQVPDAPVSRFVLDLKGGAKGLLQNSVNLCRSTSRFRAALRGQNGALSTHRQAVSVRCPSRKGGHRSAGRRSNPHR
jgi:hypothetical protein